MGDIYRFCMTYAKIHFIRYKEIFMDEFLEKRLNTAIEAAKKAGQLIVDYSESFEVSVKGKNDLVTNADILAERTIIEHITATFSNDKFYGEETGHSDKQSAQNKGFALGKNSGRWIIDPIDGTANYIRGIPHYAVSIAYEETEGEPLIGVVYNPAHNELYTAVRGSGAFLNGKSIHASKIANPMEAATIISPPFRVHSRVEEYFAILKPLFYATTDFLNFGSAALNMCYVAAGQFESYFEYELYYYDIAAGIVILAEAGGKTDFIPKPDKKVCRYDVLATNSLMHQWYTKMIGYDKGNV